jgi:uncharacterized protein
LFTYHPDPVATGSLVAKADGEECEVCNEPRELTYAGPVYSPVADAPRLCGECISSGRAARELDAVLTDLGGDGWDAVPDPVKGEVLRRTPGFSGWQQEQWRAHCADAAVFLGPAGARELRGYGPEAVTSLGAELALWGWDDATVEGFVASLDRNGMPTAYVFRCRHCGSFQVYADFT